MATARPPPFITAPAPALPPSRGQSSGIPPPRPAAGGRGAARPRPGPAGRAWRGPIQRRAGSGDR